MARSNRTHIGEGFPQGDSTSSLKPRHLTRQEFGQRVYRLMLDRNMNQSDLARRADQPRNNISTYIRGVSLPTPLNLKKLADALGVEPEILLPNHTEAAIRDDVPSLELRVSTSDPLKAWLQVNRLVSTGAAAKIIEILNGDNAADGA